MHAALRFDRQGLPLAGLTMPFAGTTTPPDDGTTAVADALLLHLWPCHHHLFAGNPIAVGVQLLHFSAIESPKGVVKPCLGIGVSREAIALPSHTLWSQRHPCPEPESSRRRSLWRFPSAPRDLLCRHMFFMSSVR